MLEKIRTHAPPFAVLLLFCAVYYPAFSSIAGKWAASEDYAHGFLIFPIILYMFWQKRDLLMEGTGRDFWGITLLAISAGLYVVALNVQIPTLIYLSTALTVVSAIIYVAGFRALKDLFMPLLLLFLIIPLPAQLLSTLTASLQLRVSELSETLFRLSEIPLLREGNIISIPGKTFQVVEACSGIRSLLAMITVSLIVGYFALRKNWTIAVLFLASCVVALILNVVRVAAFILAFYYLEIDLTSGDLHTVFGAGLFLGGFALIILLKGFLKQCEKNVEYS